MLDATRENRLVMPDLDSASTLGPLRRLPGPIILTKCVVAVFLLCQCGGAPQQEQPFVSLMDEVINVTDDVRSVTGMEQVPDARKLIPVLDSAVAHLTDVSVDTPFAVVDQAIHQVYGHWGMTFDRDRDNILSLLPHTALQSKSGSCLGTSLLFLLLSEKGDLPFFGVLLPTHFFVRYDEGEHRRNIEPNLGGYPRTDDYYREQYGIAPGSRYDKLLSLTNVQVAAVLRYNVGNILRIEGMHKKALSQYERAVYLMPCFAEAWGNFAITQAFLGKKDEARHAFDKAREAWPDMPGLALNVGNFELAGKNYEKALAAFEEGLEGSPNSPELLHGAAVALRKSRRTSEAREGL